jgi:AcrR family transcriptional regulator
MTTRRYEQRARAQTAEQTRRRVLDALAERLQNAPSETVSVDQIAQLAGVSRSTVYLSFESRAGLFSALGADLLRRGGFDQMLQATSQPDARQGLRDGLHGVVRMYSAHRDVLRALYSMAQIDPDIIGPAVAPLEQGRATGARYRAQRLAEAELLRPDVTIDKAADLLWVLTSFDTFDLLRTGRHHTLDTIATQLTTIAERTLYR